MTTEELRELPAVVTLMTAAQALGCGRSLAYDLARRHEFPCPILRLGNRYLVPTAGLLAVLGLSAKPADPTGPYDAESSRTRTSTA
jgi:predicted DNA-binding transcriptional regulator AlpA